MALGVTIAGLDGVGFVNFGRLLVEDDVGLDIGEGFLYCLLTDVICRTVDDAGLADCVQTRLLECYAIRVCVFWLQLETMSQMCY